VLITNGIYWILLETGLALIAVNLPLLYGTFKNKGLETVVRSLRSLRSIRSLGSMVSERPSHTSGSNLKKMRSSQEETDSIELVPGKQSSMSKITHTKLSESLDLEKANGQINVIKSYTVNKYGQ